MNDGDHPSRALASVQAGRREPDLNRTSTFEEAVDARRFDVEYEPLIELTSGRRCAYEALARFHGPDGAQLPTAEVFAWLHAHPTLLAAVECDLKAEQVARAPRLPLFVNLDPDSYAVARERELPILAALRGHPAHVVVEVVESSGSTDAGRIRRTIREVRECGAGVALDDLGAPNALISLESLVQVDVLKLDRSVIAAIADLRYRNLTESLLAFARKNGTRTVLEGIESHADLAIAEALGVDLVQGYLFRDQFVTAKRCQRARRERRDAGLAAMS